MLALRSSSISQNIVPVAVHRPPVNRAAVLSVRACSTDMSSAAHIATALALSATAGAISAKALRKLNHQTDTLRASDFGAGAGAAMGAAMLANHAVVERLGVTAWALPAAVLMGTAYWTLTEAGKRPAIAGEWVMVGGLGAVGAGLCVSLFETLIARGVPAELALPLAVALPAAVLGGAL